MKANKRIRDLRRRSATRLVVFRDGVAFGTTLFPTPENKVQRIPRREAK